MPGKTSVSFSGSTSERPASTAFRVCDNRSFDYRVAGSARGDVQAFENGHAAGDQGAERAGEARDGDLAQQHANERQLQQDMIDGVAALRRSVPELQGDADADEEHENQEAVDAADEIAQPDDDAGGKRQVDAEAVEQRGENRDDLPKQQGDDPPAMPMTATG